MTCIISLLAVVLVFLQPPVLAQSIFNEANCTVTRVIDGDTIKVNCTPQSIRLCSIDAPEKRQPLGTPSTDYLRDMINAQVIQLTPVQLDPYGRIVGEVRINGRDVSALMARAGHAYPLHYKGSACTNFDAVNDQGNHAKQYRLGVWADPSSEKPWEFRRR